jgi:hypothetical protein
LTPQQQRIAIAEACGAKWARLADNENAPKCWQLGFNYKDKKAGSYSLSERTPWQVDYIVADKPDDSFPITIGADVSDYLSDLNAMHEAEKVLTDEQDREYRGKLVEVCGSLADALCATAAQRAEAFLRTLNLWTD